jgi:hypothetical protein
MKKDRKNARLALMALFTAAGQPLRGCLRSLLRKLQSDWQPAVTEWRTGECTGAIFNRVPEYAGQFLTKAAEETAV